MQGRNRGWPQAGRERVYMGAVRGAADLLYAGFLQQRTVRKGHRDGQDGQPRMQACYVVRKLGVQGFEELLVLEEPPRSLHASSRA
jgi:hypothetical protein